MSNNTNQEIQFTKYDKFGIITSAIGLVADILALGAFGFSLVNISAESPLSGALWISIMTIIPLLYSWGFLAWLANSKYKKMAISIVFTGLLLSPLYIIWGAIVLGEGILSYYRYLPHFVDLYVTDMLKSRIEGGIMAIPLQIVIGLIVSFVLKLWNILIAQVAQEKIKPTTKPTKPRKAKALAEKDN